jgi:hypothetical protein
MSAVYRQSRLTRGRKLPPYPPDAILFFRRRRTYAS